MVMPHFISIFVFFFFFDFYWLLVYLDGNRGHENLQCRIFAADTLGHVISIGDGQATQHWLIGVVGVVLGSLAWPAFVQKVYGSIHQVL